MAQESADFRAAYELFRQAKSGNSAARQDLIETLLPFAEAMALRKHRAFRHGHLRRYMTEDQCISAAHESLCYAVDHLDYKPLMDSNQFAQAITVALERKLTDLTRNAYRSYDAEKHLRQNLPYEQPYESCDDPMDHIRLSSYQERVESIMPTLKASLPPTQFESLNLLIQSLPSGLSMRDIARGAGIHPTTFKSNILRAREQLANNPQASALIEDIIHEIATPTAHLTGRT